MAEADRPDTETTHPDDAAEPQAEPDTTPVPETGQPATREPDSDAPGQPGNQGRPPNAVPVLNP